MLEKSIFSSEANRNVSLTSKEKKVTFALEDDITYIYPWSPTKYLLFGKYTEEQLHKRKKFNNKEHESNLIPILKKQQPINDICICSVDQTVTKANGQFINNPLLSSLTSWSDAPNTLEEIQVEEVSPRHPVLPSMAIFSPSQDKEIISNSPNNDVSVSILKPIKTRKSKKKKLNTNFALFGQGMRQKDSKSMDCLPRLTTAKVNKALFGSIKQIDQTSPSTVVFTNSDTVSSKYFRIPSVDNKNNSNHLQDLQFKPAPRKPLIRTQISQRYALNESDFLDIQNLTEEDFQFTSSDMNTSKKTRQSLPSIFNSSSKQGRNTTSKHKEATNLYNNIVNNNNINARHSTLVNQPIRIEKSPKIVKSCRQQVKSPVTHRDNMIHLQLPRK